MSCTKFSFSLLALCYHMSNGIRHLLWDLVFFLELSKVYTSGIIMLFYATFLVVSNTRFHRFYFTKNKLCKIPHFPFEFICLFSPTELIVAVIAPN